jgi:hypothetical protein
MLDAGSRIIYGCGTHWSEEPDATMSYPSPVRFEIRGVKALSDFAATCIMPDMTI